MPIFEITTKLAESIWRSPDGQREIFEVVFELTDKPGANIKAKTYSHDISAIGWVGEVESYEKDGRNGPETFVRQPKKDFQPSGGKSYQPKDEKAIQAMWAVGQAVQLYISEKATSIEDAAVEMFALVETVKTSGAVQVDSTEVIDDVVTDTPIENLKAVLGDVKDITPKK